MEINTQFLFHPVGQGCFYSGLVHLKNERLFSFVYDCGSNSPGHYLQQEIQRFRRLLNGTLDLLIISHFDEDHVNGVKDLLKDIRCKRLVIPYLSPEERLLMYVNAEGVSGDYRLMMQNPVAYFSNDNNFRIEEIVVVHGPDEGEGFDLRATPQYPHDGVSANEVLFVDVYSAAESENLKTRMAGSGESNAGSHIRHVKIPFKFSVKAKTWEFVFYVKNFDKPLLFSKFKSDIDTLLRTKGLGSIYQVFDDEHLEEIKDIYKGKISANLNNTSLVTYHGSLHQTRSYRRTKVLSDLFRKGALKPLSAPPFSKLGYVKNGTLMTGDIDINGPQKTKKMTDYFHAYLDKVLVFQVPHHGSRHNWYITGTSPLHNFSEYVINHGLGRPHHPGIEVVQDIKLKCKAGTIHLNNENDCFYYSFYQIPIGVLQEPIKVKPLSINIHRKK